jgi:hypothetical protein
VLPVINLRLVSDLADIDRVRQDLVQMTTTKKAAPAAAAGPVEAHWDGDALAVERPLEPDNAADLKVALVGGADQGSVFIHHVERTILHPVTERDDAAHPESLLLGRGDLVADALARDLPLELGKREQHVERQSAHRRGGVEALCDRHKGHLVRVKELDQLGEVRQGAGQPVDLVDDNHIDAAGPHSDEESLKGWPLHRAARETAVVEVIADEPPALMGLALDVGL